MFQKKLLIAVIVLVVIGGAAYLLFFRQTASSAAIYAEVKKAPFEISVVTTGELRSKVRTKITAPQGLRQIGVYQIKISKLVPEGTQVKKGDFVASLDNADVLTKMNDLQLELNKQEAQYTQTKLDTMLNLRAARDELVNLRFELKQKKLEKEQSKYEAPSVIQQVELDYEKAARTLKQKEANYKTKKIQAQTKMQIIGADLQRIKNRMAQISGIMQHMSITAPKDGMVIYEKNWDGVKKTVGSVIQIWDGGTVATLPDLTQMEVVTYVNEVDIQKVNVGQKVDIGLDAMPDKHLDGVVEKVASIGQQKPNSDAKVFEVIIDVLTKDSTLRPAMSTSCNILSKRYQNGLQIPLGAIYNSADGSYVFTRKSGHAIKQQIKVMAVNETSALVSNGLEEGEDVYLSLPADTSGLKLIALNPEDNAPPKQLKTIDTTLVPPVNKKRDKSQTDSIGAATASVVN